jgi:hypothetical protein
VKAPQFLFLKGHARVSEVMLTQRFEHLDVQNIEPGRYLVQ